MKKRVINKNIWINKLTKELIKIYIRHNKICHSGNHNSEQFFHKIWIKEDQ